MRAYSFVLLIAAATVSIDSTAMAKFQESSPVEAKFRFLGELHDNSEMNDSFAATVSVSLSGNDPIDTIATELVPEELDGEFQKFLKNPEEQRDVFFSKLNYSSEYRPLAFSKLNTLATFKQQYGESIKICGIEATALEHLSDDPSKQMALMKKRFSEVPEAVLSSAIKTFDLKDLSTVEPGWNVDREIKMASNLIECARDRKAALIHVGRGHAYHEDRSQIPGWRTLLDIVEDYSSPAKAASVVWMTPAKK